jgi:TfoX/Sxy family transcriptional regulator of competence genes
MKDKAKISALEITLNETSKGLDRITSKKMFGCHALFAAGNVFALVWKHGQIGVKLTDEKDFGKLMAIKGSGPWMAGPMKMSHWVLVSDSTQNDASKLRPWLERAHAQALAAPPKAEKKKAKKGSK